MDFGGYHRMTEQSSVAAAAPPTTKALFVGYPQKMATPFPLQAPPKTTMPTTDFTEALRDSPTFRAQINEHQQYFGGLQKRLEEMSDLLGALMDHGRLFVSSFYTLTAQLNGVWAEVHGGEAVNGEDPAISNAFSLLSEALAQIHCSNKTLMDYALPQLQASIDSFIKTDLGRLSSTRSHFDALSRRLAYSLGRKAAIGRHRPAGEMAAARQELSGVGTCFAHCALDLVAAINVTHSRKRFIILDALWKFVQQYAIFFQKGAQFFTAESPEILAPENVPETLANLRSQCKTVERKMRDRHSCVPKEIFEFQTGIPSSPLVVMDGYLFKRSSSGLAAVSPIAHWKRRWFMIVDDKLIYCHQSPPFSDSSTTSAENGTSSHPPMSSSTESLLSAGVVPQAPPQLRLKVLERNLARCIVRAAPPSVDRTCTLELVAPKRSHLLQADSELLCTAWIRALQRTIHHLRQSGNVEDEGPPKSAALFVEAGAPLSATPAPKSFIQSVEAQLKLMGVEHQQQKEKERHFSHQNPPNRGNLFRMEKPQQPKKQQQKKQREKQKAKNSVEKFALPEKDPLSSQQKQQQLHQASRPQSRTIDPRLVLMPKLPEQAEMVEKKSEKVGKINFDLDNEKLMPQQSNDRGECAEHGCNKQQQQPLKQIQKEEENKKEYEDRRLEVLTGSGVASFDPTSHFPKTNGEARTTNGDGTMDNETQSTLSFIDS